MVESSADDLINMVIKTEIIILKKDEIPEVLTVFQIRVYKWSLSDFMDQYIYKSSNCILHRIAKGPMLLYLLTITWPTFCSSLSKAFHSCKLYRKL